MADIQVGTITRRVFLALTGQVGVLVGALARAPKPRCRSGFYCGATYTGAIY